MSDLPFTKEILRVAARATGHGRLDAPDGTATCRSPTCGDRITVDVALEDGRITTMAHDARACVLCQASAAILSEALPGHRPADVDALLDQVRAMLEEDAEPPAPPFADYDLLRPAAAHKNRHRCVTLPLEATLEAIATARVSCER